MCVVGGSLCVVVVDVDVVQEPRKLDFDTQVTIWRRGFFQSQSDVIKCFTCRLLAVTDCCWMFSQTLQRD